jgi:hypothetical protein
LKQVEWIARGRSNALWIFAIASLLAVGLGAAVMAQADIPLGIWIRNPIAWFVAGALTIFFARLGWLGAWLAPVAVILMTLSLFGPGQEGVHRWLDLGPVQLNAAGLVLPVAIVAIDRARDRLAFPCLLVIAAMLAWQPDISQLAAFSLAAIVIASSRRPGLLGLATSTFLAVGLSEPPRSAGGCFPCRRHLDPGLVSLAGARKRNGCQPGRLGFEPTAGRARPCASTDRPDCAFGLSGDHQSRPALGRLPCPAGGIWPQLCDWRVARNRCSLRPATGQIPNVNLTLASRSRHYFRRCGNFRLVFAAARH